MDTTLHVSWFTLPKIFLDESETLRPVKSLRTQQSLDKALISPLSVVLSMLIEYGPPDGQWPMNEAYLAGLRARNPVYCNHFCSLMTPLITAKLRSHRFTSDTVRDLTQDVFLAVFKRIDAGQPQDPAKLRQYVAGICNHIAKQRIRVLEEERRWLTDVEPDILQKKQQSALQNLIEQELMRDGQTVLLRLRRRDREILIDVYHHKLPSDDLCKKYKRTKDQLRVIKFHAIRRFLREWNRYESTRKRDTQ